MSKNSSKNIYICICQIRIWKYVHLLLLGNCKLTQRYHYITVRMAKIQKPDNPKASKDAEQQELSFIAGRNAKLCSLEDSLTVTKLNIVSSYDPTITVLGIYPIELKTYIHTHTHTNLKWMLAATFSITAQNWKQPRCPPIDKCLKKLWYIQTTKKHTAIKEMSYKAR